MGRRARGPRAVLAFFDASGVVPAVLRRGQPAAAALSVPVGRRSIGPEYQETGYLYRPYGPRDVL